MIVVLSGTLRTKWRVSFMSYCYSGRNCGRRFAGYYNFLSKGMVDE
jgi:hypothetical protein